MFYYFDNSNIHDFYFYKVGVISYNTVRWGDVLSEHYKLIFMPIIYSSDKKKFDVVFTVCPRVHLCMLMIWFCFCTICSRNATDA